MTAAADDDSALLAALGAILAICVLYRAKIMLTVSGVLKREPVATRFATAVIVAFLPAAVVGVALHKYIKALLDKPIVVAVALFPATAAAFAQATSFGVFPAFTTRR